MLYHDLLQKRTCVRSHYVSLEMNGNADVNQNGRDVWSGPRSYSKWESIQSPYSGPSCSRLFRSVVDSEAKSDQQLSKLPRLLPALFLCEPFSIYGTPMLWLLMYSMYTQSSIDKDRTTRRKDDIIRASVCFVVENAHSSISDSRVKSEWLILGEMRSRNHHKFYFT